MVRNDRNVYDSEGNVICRPLVPLGTPWPHEAETRKVENPVALAPPTLPRHRTYRSFPPPPAFMP